MSAFNNGREIDIEQFVPDVLRNVDEYKAIMSIQNPAMIKLWEEIETLYYSQYILQAPLVGIEMFEKMHDIVPFNSDTLEDRRYRIWLLYNQAAPFTRKWLKERLDILIGVGQYTLNIDTEHFTLTIFFNVEVMKSIQSIQNFLEMCLPANMHYGLPISYRTHGWLKQHKLTHGEMRPYKHTELRTLILENNEVVE